jgi:hypothetical protein
MIIITNNRRLPVAKRKGEADRPEILEHGAGRGYKRLHLIPFSSSVRGRGRLICSHASTNIFKGK